MPTRLELSDPTASPADAPVAHVLSNGRLTTIVTAAGGGRTTLGPLALTRWTPDRTRDADGACVYLRDEDTGAAWSPTAQPAGGAVRRRAVRFEPGCATLAGAHDGIDARIEIAVAPDADVELRRVTLTNTSGRTRRLSVTTYLEASLDTPAGDAGHPAFSKLFVQTEWDAERGLLLARRRPRSPEDAPLWAAHALTVGDPAAERAAPEHETDRARFLGRGRTPAHPRALDVGAPLEGTVGNVLDPVLALRRHVEIEDGARVRLVALLSAGETRDAALVAIAQHATAAAVDRAFAAAGSRADALFAELGADAQGGALARALGRLLVGHPAAGDAGAWRTPADDRALLGAALALARAPAAATPAPAPLPGGRRFVPLAVARDLPDTHAAPEGWDEPLTFWNGHGGFTTDGREYVVRLDRTAAGPALPPLPWVNVIANERVGFIASERGFGSTWNANSRENRLTPWPNDPVSEPLAEALWLRDEDAGVFWSATPGPTPAPARHEVRHGFGYTRWRQVVHGLAVEATAFVPRHDPVRLVRLRVVNLSDRPRRLTAFAYAQWVLGGLPWETAASIATRVEAGAVLAENPRNGEFAPLVAVAAVAGPGAVRASADRTAFLGALGSVESPAALGDGVPFDGRAGEGLDPCAAFTTPLDLAPGQTATCTFLLGQGDDADAARTLVTRYRDPAAVDAALHEVTAFWRTLVEGVQVATPSPALDLMLNGWLAYQNLSCRMWGRTAFYQSGGAFGFRDQLQDASALLYLDPAVTRRQIVLHAAHQFVEGDVLHWWHPPLAKGIRTRFADDLLWLPYVTAFYVDATGDAAVLDEPARLVTARPLADGEDEAFLVPDDAGTAATIYEHCCLALDRSLTEGAHGLPLMGTGDWNDGMNRVGREGRGESVWLGFFLVHVLDRFLPRCAARGDAVRVERYAAHAARLAAALDAEGAGWDGAWYRRAYYDDGTPLGAASNDECRIDTIAQAWAVISGVAPPDRAARALDAMERELVSEAEGIIRLLTPAFDRTPHDPGYIKGYLPGVRENGGQYTHGALWAVKALADLGRRDRAARLLEMLSPVTRGGSVEASAIYRVEPYVIAADVYGVAPHVGRGGWTWYTGSAGWMFRVGLESVLGLTLDGGTTLRLRPCVPREWPGFTVRYRLPDGRTTYELAVTSAADGAATTVDGEEGATVEGGAVVVPLRADGGTHRVAVALGDDVGPAYVARSDRSPTPAR